MSADTIKDFNDNTWNSFGWDHSYHRQGYITDGNELTSGGGWVKIPAVPEPATGALALAGVALLFRRRRA